MGSERAESALPEAKREDVSEQSDPTGREMLCPICGFKDSCCY